MGLSWKAIRKGKTYCAPACGMGCTHDAFLKANRLADALIKKCEREAGGKWAKIVSENLGWHYHVYLKGTSISIYQSNHSKSTYSIMGGTHIGLSVRTHSKSIKWLMRKQISLVKKESAHWIKYLETYKHAIGK